MKRLFQLCLLMFGAWALGACCSPEEDIEKITPRIMGQSVTSGAVNVSVEPDDFIILFDRPVSLYNESEIFFTPAVPVEIAVSDTKLTITTLEAMQYDSDYTLTIGYGAVKDSQTGGENLERIITFRTEEGPYVAPSEPATVLVTPNAHPVAQMVYDYLWAMYGRYTLSSASMSSDLTLNECEWVKQWTGFYPAILNIDYQYLYASPEKIDYTDIHSAKIWWNEGGLLSACWHWMVPPKEGVMGNYTCDASATRFNVNNVFVEGSWERKIFLADLAEMADILSVYQKLGIPIIWRPLHEAAGNTTADGSSDAWFWWGAAGGEAYKKLWREMFDYFQQRGLNNLIWVWNTRQGDIAFYPGDGYVDIVACDIYSTLSASSVASTWSRTSEIFPHRMISLCEMGKVASMTKQLDNGAMWSYFMPWYDTANNLSEGYAHPYASISWWSEAFADSRVISRDKLPAFK